MESAICPRWRWDRVRAVTAGEIIWLKERLDSLTMIVTPLKQDPSIHNAPKTRESCMEMSGSFSWTGQIPLGQRH